MNGMKHTIRVVVIAVTLACITVMLVGGSVIAETRPDLRNKALELRNKALELLSEEINLPIAILEIRGEHVEHLEYIGQDIFTFLIFNLEAPEEGNDRAFYVTLSSDGQRVNHDEMVAQNRAIKKATYGKLEPALYNLLQTIGPDETIKVTIWMTFEVEVRPSPTEEEIETKGWDAIEEEDKMRRRRNAEGIKQFAEPIARDIEGMGGEVTFIDELTATMSARLTRTQVEAIAQRDNIRKISGPSPGKAGPLLDYHPLAYPILKNFTDILPLVDGFDVISCQFSKNIGRKGRNILDSGSPHHLDFLSIGFQKGQHAVLNGCWRATGLWSQGDGDAFGVRRKGSLSDISLYATA